MKPVWGWWYDGDGGVGVVAVGIAETGGMEG